MYILFFIHVKKVKINLKDIIRLYNIKEKKYKAIIVGLFESHVLQQLRHGSASRKLLKTRNFFSSVVFRISK